MRPLYIFDLDGTLALIEHRRHYVEGPKPDWPKFYAACPDDKPNLGVIQIMQHLGHHADIWIFSGRSDEVRNQTVVWLHDHTPFVEEEFGTNLLMRRKGDYTPDEVLKRNWLRAMTKDDRERLVAVFEDRDRMVAMWRNEGITCCQVAPGEF